jgi:hypothetical protein
VEHSITCKVYPVDVSRGAYDWMIPMATQVHDGKQLAAGRVLAGLGIRELARAAGIAPRTLHRLETAGVIHVSERKRHGHVQRAVWDRIVVALRDAGVELLQAGGSFGAGVRWVQPRSRRDPVVK